MVEPERKYLHQFESVAPDDPILNQAIVTLTTPSEDSMRLRTILLSDLLSNIKSQIIALSDSLQKLEAELANKTTGDYALKSDLEAYQPAGQYASQEFLIDAIAILQAAINDKQPVGNYQPSLTISDAGLALIAADSSTQKRLIGYGFHYYQQAMPTSPKVGERWGELDSKGILVDEWVWDEERWISPQSLFTASSQINISTYPTSVFFGYVGTKYDTLIERISLNYNQAFGFVAGTTYCSAKFQLTGTQLDHTNTTIPGYYREIGIINQASGTGSTSLDVNKKFITDALHYAIGVAVTKVGTGSTGVFYSSFGIQYRLVKKLPM